MLWHQPRNPLSQNIPSQTLMGRNLTQSQKGGQNVTKRVAGTPKYGIMMGEERELITMVVSSGSYAKCQGRWFWSEGPDKEGEQNEEC